MFSDGDSDELDVGFPSRRTSSAMQHNAPTSGVAVRGGNTAQHISLDSVGENDHHDGAAYRGRRPSLEGVDQMQRRGSRRGLGMQRRPSLSTLATGERKSERMQRRPSSGALGTGERMQRRPSLGSLATGERTAQQVSSRDMRDDGKRSRLRSRSRDAIGRSGMQRRPSLGNLVDEDTTERRRSRSRDPIGRSEPQRRSSLGRMDIGRDTDDHSDQGAATVSTEFEDADRFEVDRKDGLQRQSSLSEMQQTAKELLPLVGWDASDAASSIAERDHNLHQPQGHKSIQIRSRDVFDQKVCTSLTDGENRSNVEDGENKFNFDGPNQVGGSQTSETQESTAVGTKPVNESPPLMGWGASDAASSSSENDQAKDDESFGSDDGTEIYEDFRPRGEFRESTSKPISERKVEEEFDSRRPWRKAPVDQRPHLKKGTSESGSVMSFSMDANAAIPKDRRSSRFDPGTIDEGVGVNQPVARKADATNLVRKGSANTAGKEGSELDELEMARTALGRTEFAFSDRGALRSTLMRAGDTHHTDSYGNTNPYGAYVNPNSNNRQSFADDIHDHPGPYTGPLDREHEIQARADDVKRSSFTSSSEGDEEEGMAGTFTDLRNDDNDSSKVEVDTSLLRETAARPKKESVDSQTTTTAQVYSESAESEQQQLFGADDSSRDPMYLEEGADTSHFSQHQPDGPSAHGDAINPVTQHHQKEAVLPTSVTNETNSKQVSFEAMGIEPSSNQGQDVGDAGSSEYDEEEARDTFDTEDLTTVRPESSQPDERRKLMETAQSGASGESLGYNESSPDMVTSNADQGRSDRDWPSYADQEASEPALEEKKQRLGSRGSRRFSAMFISSNLISFKPSGGKIQSCVGPYVWERRKLFLIGFLLSLALIAGLSAAFAVIKNGNAPVSDDSSRPPSSVGGGFPGGSIAPTQSSYPTKSPAPNQLRTPTPSPIPAPTFSQTLPSSPSYAVAQTIVGVDENDFTGFSTSLSSDGTFMAIGSKQADGDAPNSGVALVFQLSNGTWSRFGGDVSGSATGDEFGSSLSISDDGQRLAVGARSNDDAGTSSGHVRVFQYSETGDWEQLGSTIAGAESQDRAGYSVAISGNGNRLAVGAPRGGDDTGSVRIFENDGTDWVQIGQELFGDEARVLAGYSCSLSRDGNIVAMSVLRSSSTDLDKNGHVSMFRLVRSETSVLWQKIGDDISGENSGDQNGVAISLSADGSLVAIGANGYDHQGVENSGYCRVFRNEPSTGWTQLGFSMRGVLRGEQSGFSVSLSGDGNRIACGGANSPVNGDRSGVVRVYDYRDDWVQIGSDLSLGAGAAFGYSVSLTDTGGYLLVGAPEESIDGLSNVGEVNVYTLLE